MFLYSGAEARPGADYQLWSTREDFMKTRLSIPVTLFFLLLVGSPASAGVSNDQVRSQHIREADGTSGQNTNTGAGVKTGHIQNAAITGEPSAARQRDRCPP